MATLAQGIHDSAADAPSSGSLSLAASSEVRARVAENAHISPASLSGSSVAADAPARPEVAPPKRSRAKIVLPVLVAAALGVFGVTYALGVGKESTDDAFVEGHVANVAARVTGQVKKVNVTDNAEVKVGDVLVELDDRDFLVRVASAKADLAAAKAQLKSAETQLALTSKTTESNLVVAKGGLSQASSVTGTSRAGIDQARADITASESRRKLADADLKRFEELYKSGAISSSEIDSRRAAFEQADAALIQARARLTSAEANISNAVGTTESARGRLIAAQTGPEQVAAAEAQVDLAKAHVDQTQAALDQAELNLSYTKVRAESAGQIARRTVEVGQFVSPERPMLAIVPLDDTWVVANFKEDQIAHMKAEQKVSVEIDTFGGRSVTGHVDSLAGGTGSRFSLLPPDNASGNFTKVVQRVPVLIKLDAHPDLILRPGMSANVTVKTH